MNCILFLEWVNQATDCFICAVWIYEKYKKVPPDKCQLLCIACKLTRWHLIERTFVLVILIYGAPLNITSEWNFILKWADSLYTITIRNSLINSKFRSLSEHVPEYILFCEIMNDIQKFMWQLRLYLHSLCSYQKIKCFRCLSV